MAKSVKSAKSSKARAPRKAPADSAKDHANKTMAGADGVTIYESVSDKNGRWSWRVSKA